MLTEDSGEAPLTIIVRGTQDISGNWSAQTTASEIWLETESKATLSGELKIYDGAPPIHIKGFEITARIIVEALAPLDISDCNFRGADSSSRRLTEEKGEAVPALTVRNGHTTITNGDFEGLWHAVHVQDGSLSIADSRFRQNRDTMYVTGGSTRIVNTSFIASRGTALHVIGGDVVLKDQTVLLGDRSLNISVGASVRYELPAPLGRYAFIQGSSGIYNFEPGEHLGEFPFACSAGVVGDSSAPQYQSSPRCRRECPAGYSCGTGTVNPIACKNGTFCPKGSVATQDCPPGRVGMRPLLASPGDCEICPNGTRCAKGTAKLVLCGAGTFAPMPESEDCTPCEKGKYQGEEGKDHCKICPAGSWCSASSVIRCPEDTFNKFTSQFDRGACTACPEDAVAPSGSSSVSACKCVKNYYDAINDPGNVECRRCPFGSACEASGYTLAQLPLQPGFWRTNDNSSDLRRCPDASSPDTSACANMNGLLCKPWTDGPYCRICNVTDGSRYFDSDQSACVECGNKATTSLATLIGIILAVLVLLCWCGWRQPCERVRNVAYQVLPKIRAPLKQMVAFYQVREAPEMHACALTLQPIDRLPPLYYTQIVTRVESVFKVSMPASVASLLDVFAGIDLGIELFGLPLSCLQLDSFFNQLLFLVLAPYAFSLFVLGCSMATEVFTKRKDASLKAGLIRALPYLLSLAFYVFPIVFSRAFQAFDCEEFDDGTRFLRTDYSFDCSDPEYGRVVSLAWAAIVVYPVCISLLYLTLLVTARKAILTEQPTDLSRSLTFLHQDYAPAMYWWDVMETCKKVRYTPPTATQLPFLTTPHCE